jgi:hypothetical protein
VLSDLAASELGGVVNATQNAIGTTSDLVVITFGGTANATQKAIAANSFGVTANETQNVIDSNSFGGTLLMHLKIQLVQIHLVKLLMQLKM